MFETQNLKRHRLKIGSKDKELTELTRSVRRSSGSYELVAGAVLLGLVGFGLDRITGYTPWLTVSMSVLGFMGAAISIFYRYREAMRNHALDRQR